MTTRTDNGRRAARCAESLLVYGADSAPDHLIDLLADARHWCDARGERFAELDRIAAGHHAAETTTCQLGDSVASCSPSAEGDRP